MKNTIGTIGRSPSFFVAIYFAACLPCNLVAQETSNSQLNEAREAFQLASGQLREFNNEHSRVFEDALVPIHYLQWTDEGIPLVMLHGTYSTAHDFARFGERLTAAGYRPLSIDWYGHGKTPIPDDPVTANDFADDLKELLDSIGVEKAVVLGHSRGGMLASAFYLAYPERVHGLVLVDGGSTRMADYFASLGEDGLRQWLKSGFDPDTGKPLAPSYESLEELFVATWERFGKPADHKEMFDVLSQSGPNDDGRWTRWRQGLSRWLKQDNFQNTFNGMFRPEDAPSFFRSTILFDPIDAFEALDVPVLILDAVGPNGAGQQYRDSTPTADNERLQKMHPDWIQHERMATGHFVHREEPEFFIESLKSFRQKLND